MKQICHTRKIVINNFPNDVDGRAKPVLEIRNPVSEDALGKGFFNNKLEVGYNMTNKKEILAGVASAAGVLASASAASAGDVGMAPDNWAGFYAGVSIGSMGGDLPFLGDVTTGTYQLNTSAITPGAFAGFNTQMGSLVMGAEFDVQGSTGSLKDSRSRSGAYGLNTTFDAKARLGYDVGRFMPYVFVGATSQNGTAGDRKETYFAYGINYGVGAEFKATEHIIIGAEYTQRSMTGYDANVSQNVPFSNHEISLRASYLFP